MDGRKQVPITNETRRWLEGSLFFVLFCLTIPLANWMIYNVGAVCARDGPCLVPVAPGLMAPSGVLICLALGFPLN